MKVQLTQKKTSLNLLRIEAYFFKDINKCESRVQLLNRDGTTSLILLFLLIFLQTGAVLKDFERKTQRAVLPNIRDRKF